MKLLVYGVLIGAGAGCAYIFSPLVNGGLIALALCAGGWMLWSTRNAELGAIMGVLAFGAAAVFSASDLVTMGLLYDVLAKIHVPLSWALRTAL